MSLIKQIPSFHSGFAKSAGESRNLHLWKGLRGLWMPALGKQGSTLYDWSGFKNHGTLTNMSNDDWVPSQFGMSLNFDGDAEEKHIIVSNGELDFLNIHQTIFALVRSNELSTKQAIYGDSNIAGNSVSGALEFGRTANKFGYLIQGTDISALSVGTITDNNWHTVAVIRTGSNLDYDVTFCIDGVLAGTTTGIAESTGSHSNAVIGFYGDGTLTTGYWDGGIGTIAVWNRGLSFSEVRQLSLNPHALLERKQDAI